MDEILKTIENFHGHLGPYAVLGYKMGRIACEKLGSDPFDKHVTVFTGTTPPISCLVDGIQIGSGCTLGKGNISVKNELLPKAVFSNKNGDKIIISLQKKIQEEIETKVTEENIIDYSADMYQRMDDDLFHID